MEKVRVSFYHRKPRKYNNNSIETYFDEVRKALPEYIQSKVCISKYESNGFLRRIYNTVEAIFRQGDVNHITGDVHYLNSFLKKRKNILTVLDCGRLKTLKGLRFLFFKFFWYKIPVSKTSYITTLSEAGKKDLLQYINFDPEKIFVIPVCISSAFKRADKTFNSEKPRILQLGVTANKNLHRLIEALENISCTLVIVGHIPETVQALAAQKKIDLVIFDRPLSTQEVVVEYEKCDIVTLISTLEGFGMPIVEGNTVGRVVITGNITSMPEVAGGAAHLVDPFSVEEIKNGFLKIINDSAYRDQLIANGYKNAMRFTNTTIAAQWAQLYTTVAKPT